MNFYYEFLCKIFLCRRKLNLHFYACSSQSSICKNQKLLNLLDLSHFRLNEICEIAQIHKCYGKYTDIGNGRYAYIWSPYWCEPYTNQTKASIMLLTNELKSHGFDVIETNLVCSGVRIEE